MNNKPSHKEFLNRSKWAFLRGEIALPRYVTIQENHIIERSKEQVSVRDIAFGSDILHTSFEYFNEHGEAIGSRPTTQRISRQLSLI